MSNPCPTCGAPDGGLISYWRDTYGRRTQQADLLVGAFVAIAAQLDALDELPWWRRRRRQLHLDAIRDTLRLVT